MPRTTAPNLEGLPPASPERGRAYFLWLVSLMVSLLAGQALFNYLVNPLANFRDHRGLSQTRNQRKIKVDRLRAAKPGPEILILGSSRIRNLDPDLAGRILGARVFNAGVQNGGPRDWFALTRYATLELGLSPRAVMVGVDPDSFLRDTVGMNHPAYVAQLRRQLRHPWRDWLDTRKHLWSPAQTQKSWEVLVRRLKDRPKSNTVGFELNLLWRDLLSPPVLQHEVLNRPDRFYPETAFRKQMQIKRSLLEAFSEKNPDNQEGIEYWNDLVDFTSERGIALFVFIIPIHPRLEGWLVDAGAPYRQRLGAARGFLLDARARGATVCEIDPGGLNFEDYNDLYHPGQQSSNAILQQVGDCVRQSGGI